MVFFCILYIMVVCTYVFRLSRRQCAILCQSFFSLLLLFLVNPFFVTRALRVYCLWTNLLYRVVNFCRVSRQDLCTGEFCVNNDGTDRYLLWWQPREALQWHDTSCRAAFTSVAVLLLISSPVSCQRACVLHRVRSEHRAVFLWQGVKGLFYLIV